MSKGFLLISGEALESLCDFRSEINDDILLSILEPEKLQAKRERQRLEKIEGFKVLAKQHPTVPKFKAGDILEEHDAHFCNVKVLSLDNELQIYQVELLNGNGEDTIPFSGQDWYSLKKQ